MEDHHYVPVLKWKQGEQRALKDLAPEVKKQITPLIEIIQPPQQRGKPPKPLEEHLTDAATQIATCWPDARAFVDARLVRHPGALTRVLEEAVLRDAHVVPVVSTTGNAQEWSEAAEASARYGYGLCLRESAAHVVKKSYGAALAKALSDLGADPGEVDFMIDMREVPEGQVDALAWMVESAVRQLPEVAAWRSLTLVGTGFPVNLSNVPAGLRTIPRTEWQLWNCLDDVPRRPIFGDYAIAHPDLPTVAPQVMRAAASIRYTADDSWVIARGHDVMTDRYGGFSQYHSLSQGLVEHDDFQGASFSWGDARIVACASGGSPGSLTTWRQVGTNHHITYVVSQLAK